MKSILSWGSTTYRKWVVDSKKNRLIKLYDKKKYDQLAKLFSNQKDYLSVTFDEFPFIYFLISQGNKEAVTSFVKNIQFKESLHYDQSNPLKCNPLIFAYLQNKKEIAEVLQAEGFNLGIANSQGQNILHLAAIYKRKEAFMEGLRKKANHDLSDNYGNTPLHYGCRTGQLEIIEALLSGKAQKKQNLIHLFPIHMAIESNVIQAVELLRNDLWGKYPNFHPIHSAARVGACEIMRQLLKREATLLNTKDYKKMTPLHHAVATQNHESLDFLLKQREILVNQVDEFGNTALHIAFMREDLQSAKKLVLAKSDLQILNDDYLAPVDLGLDSNNVQIRSYLKEIAHKSKRLCDCLNRLMVIYSGFSTRRQEQRYNHLTKELLHLLSQMIITYIESAKIISFKQSYEKLQYEISKMDEHKYSDIKISLEIDALTQHIVNSDFALESFSQPSKKRTETKPIFRLKRNSQDGTTRSIQSAKQKPKDDQRRSLSMTSDKNVSRHTIGSEIGKVELTMQQLMSMHPLIERKMSNIRKKRYFKERNTNNFPQIQEQDEQGEGQE